MTRTFTHPCLKMLFCLLVTFLFSDESYATHAQGADLTYQCLGNNQYEIRVSFYRDCEGVNAPNTITVNLNSASCGQNMNAQLTQVPGTGQEVTPICPTMNTYCTGGNYPGVQEWVYTGVVQLNDLCNDWMASFTVCCRNNAITTINNPGGENIYLEALINNLDYPCNSSPTFSNPPVPFVCVGQQYCFNHGATDIDGDSLSYSLVDPMTGPNTTVTYLPGYSAQQPVTSTNGTTIDPVTGDICMDPTMIEVTVFAVRVEEWRNGILIGRVTRDVQMRTMICTNQLPTVSGINGTNQYTMQACAGQPISFDIFSSDPDAGDVLTLTWNNGIPGGSLVTNFGSFPTGTFTWTPTVADISNAPHCFTVTVADDNCPLYGTQTYSYCITVGGFGLTVNTVDADCVSPTGSAQAIVNGANPPVTYQWNPNLGTNSIQNGLVPGNYSVTVTDASGCTVTEPVVINQGDAPASLNTTNVPVTCHGGSDGQATVTPNGGQAPYSYQWSNNSVGTSATNLPAGTYTVTVTTASGCVSYDTVVISEPPPVLTTVNADTSVCPGQPIQLTATASGGTGGGYSFTWSTGSINGGSEIVNPQTTTVYTVSANDAAGCIGSLAQVTVSIIDMQGVTLQASGGNTMCEGGTTQVSAVVSGGTGNYNITWNNGLGAGAGPWTVSPDSSLFYVATATDQCMNSISDSVWIQVHPLPVIDLIPQDVSDCGEVTLLVDNNAANPTGTQYLWSFDDLAFSTHPYPSQVYTVSGNYWVYLTLTSPQGCQAMDSVLHTVTIHPQTIADFSTDKMRYSLFDPRVEFINESIDATTYYWDFGDGNTSMDFEPVHVYGDVGNYEVILVTDNVYGCSDTAREIIQVDPEFTYYVPNAFSPDGDGINDFFTGIGENYDELDMQVYDRWGELVFTTTSLNGSWDGTVNGRPAKSDVYVYKIKVRDFAGHPHIFSGHVSLLR